LEKALLGRVARVMGVIMLLGGATLSEASAPRGARSPALRREKRRIPA